jgi:hypothetical protein
VPLCPLLPIARPQLPPILSDQISVHSSLCLSVLALQIFVCPKGKTGTDEDDCVKTNAQSSSVVCSRGSGGGSSDLWFWVSLLADKRLADVQNGEINADSITWRFKFPISRPSRISRASSLCPTSSKASVASCPPTSSRTSSPPLDAN